MWVDNYWILSHEKKNTEQVMKELEGEVQKWSIGPMLASLWRTSTCWKEEKKDGEFRILGRSFSRDGRMQISLQGKDSERQQSPVEGREDILQQQCSVENQASKGDWPLIQLPLQLEPGCKPLWGGQPKRKCRHMPLFKCPLFHLTPIDQV